MPYIAIRRDAIEEIIGERVLQSTDFPEGIDFAHALQTRQPVSPSPRVGMQIVGSGLFVFGRQPSETQYFIFDVDQAGSFEPGDASASVLLIVQRTLRFAVKYWNKGVLTPAERIVGPTTAVIFPFPLSQKTSIRVAIDLNPDVERLAKRGRSGRFLLAYKIGTEEGGGPTEKPGLANFRRFLGDVEIFEALKARADGGEQQPAAIDSLSSTSLNELKTKIDIHQGYDTWMHLLTNDQRSFVTDPLRSPKRIDGPAGTGKTASLALAAVHAMKEAEREERDFQGIFITHSEASRRSIETVIRSMGGEPYLTTQQSIRRLRIHTLQGFCADILRQDISLTEFVDPDAYDAKQLQTMYVEEALRETESELSTYERFMSPEFRRYMATEIDALKVSLIQHEIAVVIKGRAKESLDIYKKVPPIQQGLPVRNDADRGFVWRIYERYRAQLVSGGQFDTDDVVLSALSQLSTPIWRRRRVRDGFDALFVDETHLFNMNELSIFHHLTRSETSFPIAFAVDRSQAIGDRGWTQDIDITPLILGDQAKPMKIDLKSIFRSSPDIVNLAFSITSSGASLFTNFQDPLTMAHSNMGFEEEKLARPPVYRELGNDDIMIESAFDTADRMRDTMSSSRGEVAIIAFSDDLFRRLEVYAHEHNKPVETLKERGDAELVKRAKSSGRFVLSLPDYVGGLEFDGVVLVGVDQGRVPPTQKSSQSESWAYVSFAAHNRLYVAVSRARYQVEILGTRERGASAILGSAFASKALIRAGDGQPT